MIPAEAIEEAAKAIDFHLPDAAHESGCAMRCGYAADEMAEHLATHILEAAAPILLSHEREQTRLAHIDAMVNRETKREELAEAFDYGWREGRGWPTPVDVDSGELLHDQAEKATWNPYRK